MRAIRCEAAGSKLRLEHASGLPPFHGQIDEAADQLFDRNAGRSSHILGYMRLTRFGGRFRYAACSTECISGAVPFLVLPCRCEWQSFREQIDGNGQ